MCKDNLQWFVQIDQELYEEINRLLARHTQYNDDDSKSLRGIIKMVAHELKMKI